MNFPSQIFFNDIDYGYRSATLKKSSLCLLPSYMSVATYYYYGKVRRRMLIAIVSYSRRISLVKVTKSTVSCGFGHIYGRNP